MDEIAAVRRNIDRCASRINYFNGSFHQARTRGKTHWNWRRRARMKTTSRAGKR
jgi:hypothetical protein